MTQGKIITHQAVWINTGDAAEARRIANPDVDTFLAHVPGMGMVMEIRPKDSQSVYQVGISGGDLVAFGKYLLAVAAAEGTDLKGAPSV